MIPGVGTLVNVVAVVIGGSLGVLVGDRLPARVRDVVTDGLGLVVLVIAGLNAAAIAQPMLTDDLGRGRPLLIVLAAVVLGGILGSLIRIEQRLEGLGALLQRHWPGHHNDSSERLRFVEGFVTASLVFCVGPLTILGALQDGLGDGIELLALKSVLDCFAALAFAAALGWGVVASSVTVLVVQGTLTIVGIISGEFLSDAAIAVTTATGGVLLIGVALRLLRIRSVPVGDLLPALLLAPLFASIVAAMR